MGGEAFRVLLLAKNLGFTSELEDPYLSLVSIDNPSGSWFMVPPLISRVSSAVQRDSSGEISSRLFPPASRDVREIMLPTQDPRSCCASGGFQFESVVGYKYRCRY